MASETIHIPGHSIIAELGHGGMATVYLAVDENLSRKVALKVMDPHLGEKDPSFVQRFKREAQTAASLTHPHIVPVHQFGETEDGRYWLTMAYLDGGSLTDRLQEGRITPEAAIRICRQIAEALTLAHQKNVIHRDIKPDNILFQGESASLADFGIAKLLDATTQLTELASPGTLRYMSPEQAWGEHIDQRSDIYSLGVVLYEMLTRERPTGGDSIRAVAANIAHQAPAPLPGNLSGLQPLMGLLLAKEPSDRIDSSELLARILSGIERNLIAGTGIAHATDGVLIPQPPNPAPTGIHTQQRSGSPTAQPGDTAQPARSKSLRPRILIGAGVCFLLALVVTGWRLSQRDDGVGLPPAGPTSSTPSRSSPAALAARQRASASPFDEYRCKDGGMIPLEWRCDGEYADCANAEDELTGCEDDNPIDGKLTLVTAPPGATVVLPEIKPRYQPGMNVSPGDLLVRVSSTGFETLERRVDIVPGYNDHEIRLNKAEQVQTAIEQSTTQTVGKMGVHGTDALLLLEETPYTSENTDATCSDGINNDGDQWTDCEDFDCSNNPDVKVCN